MAFLAALGPRAARTLAPVARGSVQVNRCFLSGSAVGLQARGAPRFAVAARSFGSSAKVAVIQDQQIPKDEAVAALSGKGFDVSWSLDTPSDAWAIVTVTTPVTEAVLDKHPNCKLVAVSFTGFNHVDLEACKKRGISVVNVPAYSTDAVAELSVGLALAVYREIPASERTLRAGGWAHSAGGMEIRDKVVGVVGLGDIGLRTAELFKAFGPREILGWSRRPKPAFDALGKQVSIEELFEKSDIVSLHVALNAETQGIIGRNLLERLRPEAVLINVARGGVCDQPVLAELLSQRRFRAGLDVFATEPIPADDPILKVPADQAVMIPHVAYKTVEALRRRMEITATNIRLFADGQARNVVLDAK
eukprot:CAMPEP_0181436290 /NCGR_PEP_ID=MMETSP1110-20121109/20773_1 /TAXON_ID=174948 /ORGANISM="Symbiodinium sp., Strain CCMP421" /LENGTH=362 /DNA_ID=CAMNT_0023559853 /DNA_START=61 /DNA_END=1149 /DNA_ORIENTATION=-